MIIFDQSSAFNGLVIGTSNKTEILLGYSTIYGDSACALNPIGDLYKTQVRQLAHENESSWKIKQAAMAGGMRTLRHDGWAKAIAGETSVDEVLRVTKSDQILRQGNA